MLRTSCFGYPASSPAEIAQACADAVNEAAELHERWARFLPSPDDDWMRIAQRIREDRTRLETYWDGGATGLSDPQPSVDLW